MKLKSIWMSMLLGLVLSACSSPGVRCEDNNSEKNQERTNKRDSKATQTKNDNDDLDEEEDVAAKQPATQEVKTIKIIKDKKSTKKTTKGETHEVTMAPEFKVKGGEAPVVAKAKQKPFTYRFLIREIPDRQVASIKSGMHTVDSTCQIKAKPNEKSKTAGTLQKGKKVWIEPHNKQWSKIYRKNGPGYIKSVCL